MLDCSAVSRPVKEARRAATARWAFTAFQSAVIMIGILTVCAWIFGPLIHTATSGWRLRCRRRLAQLAWQKIMMGIWTCCILYTLFAQTNGDWVSIAKRLGRVSTALLPPMYFLTLRPSLLPKICYLQLIPLHKWLSRFVVALSTAHVLLYSYLYYDHEILRTKLSERTNLAGLAALALFIIAVGTSMSSWRRRSYESFYSLHVVISWLSLVLIWAHSKPPCNGYLEMCVALLACQFLCRVVRSSHTRLRVQYVSTSLLLIEIPKAQLPSRFSKWAPASHVRLSGTLWNPSAYLRSSHPYTIASLPDDGVVRLAVRKGDYKLQLRRDYAIMGPINSVPSYILRLIKEGAVSRALFVIGGSGIAFAAPLLRMARLYGVSVKLVWAVRDPYDARILPMLQLHEDMLCGNIEVYYTGDPVGNADDFQRNEEELGISVSENFCESPEPPNRRERSRMLKDLLLKDYANNMYNSRTHLNLRLKSWLYGYTTDDYDCCCADRLVDSQDEDRVGAWVFAAGAPKLVETSRAWAQRAGVSFFEESFTL